MTKKEGQFGKLMDIINKRDGGKYAKIKCDSMVVENYGKQAIFDQSDFLNVKTKEEQLNDMAFLFEKGYITEDQYNTRVEAIEKTPDFVVAQISGKDKSKTFTRVIQILRSKEGKIYGKIDADRVLIDYFGKKILFNRDDIVEVYTKEEQIRRLEYNYENDLISEDNYQKRMDKVRSIPEFVFANIHSRGQEVQ